MSDTVQQLVHLLKRKEVWLDPRLVEMSKTLEDLTRNSSQILEKMFLSTIKPAPDARAKIIEFCVNVIKEELSKLNNKIDGKEKEYLDPITLELMRDPVNLHETGQLYDRKSLKRHLSMRKSCPVTGKNIEDASFSPCLSIKGSIDKYVDDVVDKTTKYAGLTSELLEILNISVCNIHNFPFRLSFPQSKDFIELSKKLDDVIERVVTYDEKNLTLLRIQEISLFYQVKIPELLDLRISVFRILEGSGRDEDAIQFMEQKILQTGILKSLIDTRGKEAYHQVREQYMKLRLEYYVEKEDFKKILISVREIAKFFSYVGNMQGCFAYLKKAEKVLDKDRNFLLFLARLFEKNFRKKKQASNIYFHLGLKAEEEKRFFEEVLNHYERSIRLNPKNPKAKIRYTAYCEYLETRLKPEKEEEPEEDEEYEGEEDVKENEDEEVVEKKSKKSVSKKGKSRKQQQREDDDEMEEPDDEEFVDRPSKQKRKKPKKKKKRMKETHDYTDFKKILASKRDDGEKIRLLEEARRDDPDSPFLLSTLLDIHTKNGDVNNVISLTTEPDESLKQELRMKSLLQILSSTNAKVGKLKDIMVKISKDFNRKLRIVNVQYKDIRSHLHEHETHIQSLYDQGEQRRSPPPQKRGSMGRTKQMQGEGSNMKDISFLKPRLGSSAPKEEFTLMGIKFTVTVALSMNTSTTVTLEVHNFPRVDKHEYKLTAKFKGMVDEKFIDRTTKVITFDKFSMYTDLQWVFSFELNRID